MLLPGKHLTQRRALLPLGAEILRLLHSPKTVSRVWDEFKTELSDLPESSLTFDWFVLALDVLFAIGAVRFGDGLLRRVDQ